MSILNPEKLPVTVYRWDDADAPKLDKSAGCVSTIFKACLVTGYGTKQGAGWSMPFEDLQAGIKVLRPPVSAEQDFYLRLSDDNGSKLTAQVYLTMTDINTGDLKLQCDKEFTYATVPTTGKWVLIASSRGFWFFNEMIEQGGSVGNQTGGYFFVGDTAKNSIGDKGLYIKHTGGSWSGWWSAIFNADDMSSIFGKLLDIKNNRVISVAPSAIFDGKSKYTENLVLSQLYILAFSEIWMLPAYSPSIMNKNNYDSIDTGDAVFLNHATSQASASNFYVRTDYWEY